MIGILSIKTTTDHAHGCFAVIGIRIGEESIICIVLVCVSRRVVLGKILRVKGRSHWYGSHVFFLVTVMISDRVAPGVKGRVPEEVIVNVWWVKKCWAISLILSSLSQSLSLIVKETGTWDQTRDVDQDVWEEGEDEDGAHHTGHGEADHNVGVDGGVVALDDDAEGWEDDGSDHQDVPHHGVLYHQETSVGEDDGEDCWDDGGVGSDIFG